MVGMWGLRASGRSLKGESMEKIVDLMPEKKIIETLKELRVVYRDHKKLKYWLSLGYAIKNFEGDYKKEDH